MKVLHVINGLGTGGAERSLAEMLPYLREHGIDSEVAVLFRRDRGVEPEVRSLGFHVHHISATGLPQRVRQLRRLVRTRSAKVVHSSLFEADVAARLASIGLPVTVVSSLVNDSYGKARLDDPNVTPRKLAAAREIDGFTARRAVDAFHAISPAVADAAVRDLRVSRERITVIPRGRSRSRLGYPSADRRRAARSDLDLDPGIPVVVNVARQEHQKDQATLIRAFAELRSTLPDAVLVIAGREGNASARLRDVIAEQSLDAHVRMIGHVPDAASVLAAADVFAFSSRYEGLGGALIEAMAMEVPIVSTDPPAVRELLGEGRFGCLVPVGAVDLMADQLINVLVGSGDAHTRARRAAEHFEAAMTTEAVARHMASWFCGVGLGAHGVDA